MDSRCQSLEVSLATLSSKVDAEASARLELLSKAVSSQDGWRLHRLQKLVSPSVPKEWQRCFNTLDTPTLPQLSTGTENAFPNGHLVLLAACQVAESCHGQVCHLQLVSNQFFVSPFGGSCRRLAPVVFCCSSFFPIMMMQEELASITRHRSSDEIQRAEMQVSLEDNAA
eukprot:5889313-Amphidinium_carterae.1